MIERDEIHWVNRCLPTVGFASVAVGIVVIATSNAPAALPAISFNSSLLFRLEQIVAVVASISLATSLIAWSLKGRLPNQFGAAGASFAYSEPAIANAQALAEALATDRCRVEQLETLVAHQIEANRFQFAASTSINIAIDKIEARLGILEQAVFNNPHKGDRE